MTCGEGEVQRRVSCYQDNRIVSLAQCDLTLMPAQSKPCSPADCPLWRHGDWGPVSFYCSVDSCQVLSYLVIGVKLSLVEVEIVDAKCRGL